MNFQNNTKYLFLDDIARILWKSRSFCQKEINSWRIKWEKKYILWKRKFVINKEDFITYVRTNPERVGNIENIQENIEDISKTINEIEESHRIEITNDSQKKYTNPNRFQDIDLNKKTESADINKIINSEKESANFSKNNEILANITEYLDNIKLDWTNNLYIDQLKNTIDDLKKSNLENKEEYKERIKDLEDKVNDLQDELRNESKKVERTFFISDRYEKILSKQNELLLNIINLAKSLWEWGKLSLWDIKTLISSYWVNERLLIDEKSSDIKLINESNPWFYDKLKLIDDTIIIEKSKEPELAEKDNNIQKLNEVIKKKNVIIYIVLVIAVILWIIIIAKNFTL